MKKLQTAVLAGCSYLLASLVSFGVLVEDVKVESSDNREMDIESIMAYISLRPGDEFTHQGVTQDIKNLKDSNRFSFVDVVREDSMDGIVVKYVVTEKPRIRKLRITGADTYGNKKVRKNLELEVGDYIDDATVGMKCKKVIEEYRKALYPFVKVTWSIDVDEAANLADLTLQIKEGTRSVVGLIDFEGNTVFKNKELKTAMQQRVRRWYSWITGSGVYDPDLLATDLNTIRSMYLDKGYLDVKMGDPIITERPKDKIGITIPIIEGRPYRNGQIHLADVTIFPEEIIEPLIQMSAGGVASVGEMKAASTRIQQYYGRRGYIETRVRIDRSANPSTGIADITFTVKEGHLAYIRDINISGNIRTKDKVIRRELAVYPGEVMNEVKIKTSEKRLQNLGYFSFVNSNYESTKKPGYYDLTFDVEEKRTGQFMVGAGFSSIDQLIGFVEVGQGNFDLFGWPRFTGGGQKIKLRATFGTSRQDYEFSFIEPWFLDRKLSLEFNLFRNDSQYYSDDYEQLNTGGSLSLTKPLTAYDRVTLAYSLQQIKVFNIDEKASDEIKAEEGSTLQSMMGLSLLHDTRDSVFVATRGNRTKLSSEVSGGPLGADVDMYRLSSRSTQHVPLWFDHFLSLRGELAVVDAYGNSDEVRIFDRLYLGGPRSLRGFKYRHVGPMDKNEEPIGGKTMAFGSCDYDIPVWTKLRLAAFYDIGMVYSGSYSFEGADYTGDYNSDAGVGVRIDIPGFPLRFDYAWPLESGEYNEDKDGFLGGRFSFLIGYVL